MPNDFVQSEQEYFRLRGQLETGHITREQFHSAFQKLMVQDPQGRLWMPDADSGRWKVYDGQRWIEANPPLTARPPSPPGIPGHAAPVTAVPATTSPPVIVIQSPPPTQAPTYAPAQTQSKSGGCGCSGCGGCALGCLAVIALVVIGLAAGYFAFRNGMINPADLLALVGMGPGDIEFDNFRDDILYVTITSLDTSNTSSTPSSLTFQIKSFDIDGYRAQNPGRYRLDFATTRGGRNIGTCNVTIKGGDQYQFVALPDKVVVNRANNPSNLGTDYVITTSIWCR